LVYEINNRGNGDEFFSFAGGGFRDFTRIAASSPQMWKDICIANKTAILEEIAAYETVLSELKTSVANEDSQRLMDIFQASRKARIYWGEKKDW
jgi:prephenate dehydrogenase